MDYFFVTVEVIQMQKFFVIDDFFSVVAGELL
jgi:hypothetical protein